MYNQNNTLMGAAVGAGSPSYQTFVQELLNGNPDIPEKIREKLMAQKGGLSIKPLIAYKAINFGISTEKAIFAKTEKRTVGISNLENRRPRTGELFMVDAIQIVSAEAAGATEADLQNVAYTALNATATHDVLVNGECKLVVGGTVIFDELSNQVFNTNGNTNLEAGLYMLDKPIFVDESQEIEFTVFAASTVGLTANTALKVFLRGQKASVN